ncbi:Endonuclease III like protein [Dictyocoela muelleri]|nr:Endonuclease III like protein [Dictyocoela muelleri]
MNEFINTIKKARKNIVAPVDNMGCTCVPETKNNDIKKFQILIMLVLSSRTNDKTTFLAMQKLQRSNLSRIIDIYNAKEDDINQCIGKVGFHNIKSVYIKSICKIIFDEYLDEFMKKLVNTENYNEYDKLKNDNKNKIIKDKSNNKNKSKNKSNNKDKKNNNNKSENKNKNKSENKNYFIENKIIPIELKKEFEDGLDLEINKYNKLDRLLKFPGVGKKVAFLFLENAFDIIEGIGVDTHVHRIINRLGYETKNSEETRKLIENKLPISEWKGVNKALVGYGQVVCTPKNPNCNICLVKNCKGRFSF